MWRLRELSVIDFKSFEGKHLFAPLDEFGLSCVVGLNGSGKSNIVDALAFVLGAGSRALRSAKFAELCHRDRVTGRAAARAAEVKAVFVSASGCKTFERAVAARDSAVTHRLNGRTVDRRAYNQALAEIGAFGKGCIVAQGYIESISLSSALEKGALLDQLSGSAVYKDDYDAKTKKAAQVALELKAIAARREDLEQTLKNMKKQYADLKRYNAVRARLHRAQRILAALTRQNLEWQAARFQHLCQDLQGRVVADQARIDRAQQSFQQMLTQQRDATAALREVKSGITKCQRALAAEQEAKASQAEKREEVEVQLKLAREGLQEAILERSNIEKEFKKSIAALDSTLKQIQSKKVALNEMLEAHAYTRVCRQEQEHIRSLSKSVGNDYQVKELSRKREAATQRQRTCLVQFEAVVARKAGYSTKLEEAQSTLQTLRSRVARSEGDVKNLTTLLEAERQASLEITCARNTVRALKDQLFGSAETKDNNSHVCAFLQTQRRVYGRIGDLITVLNPSHITAIGSALGRQRNTIIVETYADAVECIKLLKAKRWGVEEFLPLQGKVFDAKMLAPLHQSPDLFKPAIDCVSTVDEKFMPAVASILGDTVIVDGNLDKARDLAYRRKQLPSVRIVTLDGQKIAKNGNITLAAGPGDRAKNGAVSTAALEQRLREAETQLASLLDTYATRFAFGVTEKLGELEICRQELQQNKNASSRTAAQLDELQRVLHTCEDDLREAVQAKERVTKELADLENASAAALESLRCLNEEELKQIALYNEAHELEKQLGVLTLDEQEQYRQTASDLAAILRQMGAEPPARRVGDGKQQYLDAKAAVEARLESNSRTKQAEDAVSMLTVALEKLADTQAVEPAEDFDAREAELRAQANELSERLETFRTNIQAATGLVRELMSEKNAAERELFEATEKVKEATTQLNALAESEMVSVATLAGAEDGEDEPLVEPPSNVEAGERHFRRAREKAEVEIEDCEKEMQGMALINHRAGEMLAEVQEKAAVVQEELETKKSSKHLVDLDLADLRETRRKLFLRCFNAVNKYLDEIYLTLTRVDAETFGTAQIELEDEISSEPFNKGVIFHAIPPGKRYTDLDALSGGEKAMAALSLLFACQKFKQAPLIVLDEVDAPLDLENLASLREYLRSAQMQVLMITLKEEIYTAADAIIGVYKSPMTHNSQTLTVSLKEFAPKERLGGGSDAAAGSSSTVLA